MQTFFGMATAVLQDALVWMLWLLIALANCGGAKSSPQPLIERMLYYGHLTIGTKKLNLLNEMNPTANKTELFRKSFGDNTDHQSDSDSHVLKEIDGVTEGVFSYKRTPAVDRLLGMTPKVECVENSMTLKLHGAAPLGSPFLIDRGNAQPLPLSKVPPDCGYMVRKSWRDLAFSTPYDGCFVTQEDSIYVLPLVMYGIPVRMACPSIAPKPPSVSCHENGMTVKVESSTSVKDVHVKVNRKWESLMKVSPQCGFSVIEHPEGVIISATYLPCIKEKDGMLTFEVAAKGDFKISCPAQPSTMHARATACLESSRTECSTTSLAGPPKGTQTPIQTGAPGHAVKPQHPQSPVPRATQAPPTDRPVQPPAQFPLYYFKYEFNQPDPKPDSVSPSPDAEHSEVPQLPQTTVFKPTHGLIHPKDPVLVDDPSKNMFFHIPKPEQFPSQLPFYFFKPEFYQPGPKPDRVSPTPEPARSEVPRTPVFQPSQASPGPVYYKKPEVVEDPSKSMPSHIPKPAQSPAQFPFFFFKPEFYQPGPKPDRVSPTPEPARSEVPQTPVFQLSQASPGPVYYKKPELVEDPSKSMPSHIPKPAQSPAQFPFFFFKPEFYQPGPKPDWVSPSPEPEHSEVPQHPQTPVFQPTQESPGPVYYKKPELVEDPSKSMPSHIPKPAQSPAQFPFFFLKPEFYQPGPKPDCVLPNPQPERSQVLQPPKTPVLQPTQAPPGPVVLKKPELIKDSSKSMPFHTPEPIKFLAQFPNYLFKPEFYQPNPKPDRGSPSSKKPKCTEEPKLPQRPVPQTMHAPLAPVYPTKALSVEGHSKSLLPPQLSLAQFPVYFFNNTIYLPHSKPEGVPAITEPEPSEAPQIPGTQAIQLTPKQPVTHPPLTSPKHAHSPTEAPIGHVYQFYPVVYPLHPNSGYSFPSPSQKPKMPVPQSPNLVPTPKSKTEPESKPSLPPVPKNEVGAQIPPDFEDPTTVLETPDRVHHQSTHCITACTVAHSNCCPLALSFHQHVHHHNHFAPAFGQVVQPAPASSDKEPSFMQLLINHSLISNGNKQVPHTFLGTPPSQTASTPSVQTSFYQEQQANPDPAVQPISSPAHPINPPFLNSYMYIPTNGHWSLVPAVTLSSAQLTHLPASKLHNNLPVKEPPPYQELQYPYGFPKSSYSSGPDNPANSPETMSLSTAEILGLHRDPMVEASQSTVKHSLSHPLFQIPYFGPYPPPTSKPDSQAETEASPHQSVSSTVMLSPKSTKKSVPHQWGWHPFFNSFLRPNMEGDGQNIPDVSSDSPQVSSVLSKYSTLKHPVASSGPVPQKQYWRQAVPAKSAAHNGYPKAPLKSDASNPHPQNNISSPQNSISRPSGKSFAPLGSPQSFKDYWKWVGPPHS